jgi:hypothetical protein
LLDPQLERHAILRQQRPDVRVDEYRVHAGHGARRRNVDRPDPRMRVGAAHEGRFEHIPQRHVIDEPARAPQQRRVLDADDRLSDELQRAHARLAPSFDMRGPDRVR